MTGKPLKTDSEELTEDELIKAAQAGDKNAMNTLLHNYYRYIYGVAYKMMGNCMDAEDVTQNALINICTKIETYDTDKKFTTWIYTIALNAAREKYRKSKRYFEVLSFYTAEQKIHKNDRSTQDDLSEQILSALKKLPEKLREALVLTLYEDMSHAQAAKVLGCAKSTVSWRTHEARKILKTEFEKDWS